MATKDPALRFTQILAELDTIVLAVGGRSREEVARDIIAVRAVERSLQIVSEAAIKLGGQAEASAPAAPWSAIRGLGNVLRHAYDEIDFGVIWETIQADLPPLRAQCQAALAQLGR